MLVVGRYVVGEAVVDGVILPAEMSGAVPRGNAGAQRGLGNARSW